MHSAIPEIGRDGNYRCSGSEWRLLRIAVPYLQSGGDYFPIAYFN
jgi:hypothetical protein